MRPLRALAILACVATIAASAAACGGDGDGAGVIAGTTGSSSGGGDAGTIGDVATKGDVATLADVASSSGGDATISSGGDTASSSGGGADGGGSSGGTADTSGGSSGADTTIVSDAGSADSSGGSSSSWPAGPEDKITGVDAAKAKYTTCDKAWGCTLAACQFDPKKGCMDVCLNASSKLVVSEMMDYVKCFNHICHDKQCKSGDAKCISECAWSRCSGFAMKCNAAKKSGGKTCGTAFACFETCKGPKTVECLTKCYVTLAKPAQQDFEKLWFCFAKSDSEEPFLSCVIEALNCASGGTTGKSTCLEISLCDANCVKDAKGDKFPCTAKCYGGGSAGAQQQFGELMTCVGEAQDESGKTAASCGKTVAVCAGSKPDGTKGALGCQEIGPCEQQCKQDTPNDDGCTMQCLSKATVTETIKWWEQAMCWATCGKSCGDAGGDKCVQKCFVKSCKKESDACLGL